MKRSKKLVFFGTILSLAVVGYSSKIVFFGGRTLNFREEPIDFSKYNFFPKHKNIL